jgi:hypothetical protein
MQGTITKQTMFRHPLLIVQLWGWKILLDGLLSHSPTFLDLVRKVNNA